MVGEGEAVVACCEVPFDVFFFGDAGGEVVVGVDEGVINGLVAGAAGFGAGILLSVGMQDGLAFAGEKALIKCYDTTADKACDEEGLPAEEDTFHGKGMKRKIS